MSRGRVHVKSDRLTAEHEAAHAVVSVMLGHVVGRLTIAPPRAARGEGIEGLCQSWPARTLRGVLIGAPMAGTISAAGLARELQLHPCATRAWVGAWRSAWRNSWGDRQENGTLRFLLGLVHARALLRRSTVQAAIAGVADALEDRKSGTVWGVTVDRVCAKHGLSPRRRVLDAELPALDDLARSLATPVVLLRLVLEAVPTDGDL